MKLFKYVPNFIEMEGKIMDLNQIGRLSVEPNFNSNSAEYACYIWIQHRNNIFNNQFFYETKKEAMKDLNKIKKYLKVKSI